MKLILRSIRSLFRSVNIKIQNLIKKIEVMHSDVEAVRVIANNAHLEAKNAHLEAKNANIPICEAFLKANTSHYEITIDKNKMINGQLFILIPKEHSGSDSPSLYINGERFTLSIHNYDSSYDPSGQIGGLIFVDSPLLVQLYFNDQPTNKYAVIHGYHGGPMHFVGESSTNADQKIKGASITAGHMRPQIQGSIVFIRFKNGNTAENPYLSLSGHSGNILDRSGVAISPDAIKTNYYHQFVAIPNAWIMLD